MNHHGLSGDRKTWVEKRRTTKLSVVWSKIVKIEYVGKEEVFDLEVESSNHNFVANGIVVHNCFQEFSQRYAEVTDFEPVQLRKQAETNRQSSTEAFDPFIKEINDYSPEFHDLASDAIKKHISNSENLYKELIKAGAAKECARMVLPLTTQTRIYMKGSIRSWIHYLEARLSPHTQWEHREIAYQILKILSEKFPKVFNARFKNSTFMQDYNLFITDNS
jgi:thymidylate synthase (FAD)